MINNIRTTPFWKLHIFAGKFNEMKLDFFRLRVVHWILLEKQATARAIVNWNGCYTIAVQQRVTFPTKFTTVGYLLFWHVDNKCNHKHAKRNTSFFLSWTIEEKIVSWKLSHWIIIYYVFLFGQRPNKKKPSHVFQKSRFDLTNN